ncbi:MAG: peptidoglycan recognition protein family protein [Epibacterium sp.]|nr:peptidoglycan recognition protein family protein [Epibacterium sp.]NQX74510.1 N-acetylmuramoyl-L-alanine amidase [Epibacterium sp.]
MRRAKLHAHEVTRVILTATMTHQKYEEVTVESLMKKRRADGFIDAGWHYFVDKNAKVHFGVPADERGSMFPRYEKDTVVILIEGSGMYTKEQYAVVKRLVADLQKQYPKALLTLHYELFRGINPGIERGDIQ